jgi:hypothetical protein
MPTSPTREEFDNIIKAMAYAGVIKVDGYKMEDGKLTPMYLNYENRATPRRLSGRHAEAA